MGSKSQQQVQVTPSASAAILVVMYVAAFVAAFNENIINVALHDIMAAFSVSATTAQWLVSGYMIVTSIFTAIMAFLSGRFSTRKLLFSHADAWSPAKSCAWSLRRLAFCCQAVFAGCGIGHLVSAHDECGAVLCPAREARSVSEPGRRLHYARTGVWTRDQRSYVHVIWLEGGIRSAAGGRHCGRCGGR